MPFDLLVDPADRLDFAVLIYRTGHGDPLLDGDLRQARQNGVKLGRGRAIAVDPVVGLLETNRARQR